MSEFGGGIDLTQNLDIDLNNTGDVKTISGQDELEKDISLQSIINVEPIRGGVQTNETKTTIKRVVRDAIVQDPRIEQLIDITVRFIRGEEEAEIITLIVSSGEEQELVFTVPL